VLDGTPKWYYTSIAAAAYINQQAGVIVNLQKATRWQPAREPRCRDRYRHPTALNRASGVPSAMDTIFVNNSPGGQERIDTNTGIRPILDQETTQSWIRRPRRFLDGGSA